MTIKLYGIAKRDYTCDGLTEGKEYPIVKITYQKLFPEGLVTVVNDKGELVRTKAVYFTYKTK